MTSMRKTTSTVGAALFLAAASLSGTATAIADPDPAAPANNVRYTITTAGPYDFELFYLTSQPASMDAYNDDAYAYAKRERVTVTPEQPWVFETNLADPQWAIVSVSSTARGGMAPPNAHCDIAVDGVVAVAADHPYSPWCQLSQWG